MSQKRQLPRDPATGKPLAPRAQPGYYPGFRTLDQQKYWDAATRSLVLDRVTRSIPIRFFTPAEAVTMEAVVDRILPQEDRSPEHRIAILPVMDERLFVNRIAGYRYIDMPSDQEAYRLAARAFEQMAQILHHTAFHQLATLEQEHILESIHHAKPLAAQELWSQMNIGRFWGMLVGDCCAAYYAHPWAWDEIGFGGPAYPRGYMRLEEGEPEPWEVDEVRYTWDGPPDTLSDAEIAHGTGAEHQTHHGQGGTH